MGASSAGIRFQIELTAERFDPHQVLEQWHRQPLPAAESLFIGRMRETAADGSRLDALELEHYPGMTENQLAHLARDCAERHGAWAVLVQHRIGRILPQEAIVLVAVAADRRGPAQRCCQELLEALKHDAPFWKREWSGGVGTWVKGNTPL